MKFNPEIHHRRSIRLEGYDYSDEGAYFVTIVTRERESLFSNILDGKVHLNYAGKMIEKWWNELNEKFPMVKIDTTIIMPNHLHGILNIVGAALCGRPDSGLERGHPHRGAPTYLDYDSGQPRRVAPTLGKIMDWFKTMTTNEYIRGVKEIGWSPFCGKLWQSRGGQPHRVAPTYLLQNYIKMVNVH